MRTTEFVRIEGRFEIWAVKVNGRIVTHLKRLITNWK
jgi:hypothetical protein